MGAVMLVWLGWRYSSWAPFGCAGVMLEMLASMSMSLPRYGLHAVSKR